MDGVGNRGSLAFLIRQCPSDDGVRLPISILGAEQIAAEFFLKHIGVFVVYFAVYCLLNLIGNVVNLQGIIDIVRIISGEANRELIAQSSLFNDGAKVVNDFRAGLLHTAVVEYVVVLRIPHILKDLVVFFLCLLGGIHV